MARDWNPDEVFQALDTELAVHEDRSIEEIAKRKLRDSAAHAADSIIHLAIHSENESLRLKASAYIIDRVMGKITDVPMGTSADDSLASLLKGVVTN